MQKDRSVGSLVARWGAIVGMAAGLSLVVKVAYVYAIGGGESPLIGWLYITGVALPLFAAVGVAAHFARGLGARIAVYIGTVFVHAFFIMMLSVEGLVNAVADVPAYVTIEIPIALAGLAWLAIGYRIWSKAAPSGGRTPVPGTALG